MNATVWQTPAKLARDTWLIFSQEAGLMVRSPVVVLMTLVQPASYLIFFAPFLKVFMAPSGAQTYGDAYRIYVPGLLVSMGLFGGLFAGYGLLAAMRAGILDRCRVTPISRTGLLLGRSLMHVCLNVVQAVIITILAVPFGLRVDLLNLLLAYLLLSVMILLSASISFWVALRVRDPNSLGITVNLVSQPLSLLAGVLIPLVLAPMWMQELALWNPFAWATNGMRALFAGHLGDPAVWQGALIIATLGAVAVVWSSRVFNRDVA
jgi:ABC-2 type transport system permease protein